MSSEECGMAKIESRMRICRLLSFSFVVAAVYSPPVLGQETTRDNANDVSGNPGDVYINESFEAAGALTKAGTLTAQNRWREAAEILQNASETLSDHIVRTPEGFTGLRSHVADIVCAWPEEGIRAYQSLYDPVLQRELRTLGD